jgi:thioredoxin 1
METMTFMQIAIGLLLGGACGVLLSYLGRCASASGTCLVAGNPRRGGLLGAATGAVMGLVLVFSAPGSQAADRSIQSAQSGPENPSTLNNVSVVPITTEDDFLQLVMHTKRPVVVNFYSDSCPPCRQLAPTVEKIAQDYRNRVVVYSVRIEDLPSLVALYDLHAVPTLMFFRNGHEAERMVGLQDRDTYVQALGRLLITERMV